VDLVLKNLSPDVIEQYQEEERTAMAHRVVAGQRQLMELINIMMQDELSEGYKIKLLREELNQHFNTTYFSRCKTMGAIVKRQLKQMLQQHLKLVQKI
jgi:hypothetical protein